jgi:flagellar assembly protein FliH
LSEVLRIRKVPGGSVRLMRVAPSRLSRVAAEGAAISKAGPADTGDGRVTVTPIPVGETSHEERVLQAYQQGFVEGREAADAEFKQVLADCRVQTDERIGALLGAMGEQLRLLGETLERDAYQFALAVAARIIKREVTIDNDTIVRQIKGAIRRVVGVETIKMRVHPDDEEIVREHRAIFLSSAGSIRDLVIEVDDSLEPGGCIIESTAGNVDARIATQISQVATALFDQAPSLEERLP